MLEMLENPNQLANTPMVSVVMAVYNGALYLETAIPSILNQSYKNFEFIIVNDGSTDYSLAMIKKYAALDPRIVILDQKNTGLTVALNNGINIARGKYIARQDVDDISMPNRLELQLQAIEDCSLLVGGWLNFDKEHERSPKLFNFMQILPFSLQLKILSYVNPFTHGTYFFIKEDFLKVGGYRKKFKFAQDYDLLLRFTEHFKFKIHHQVIYKLRIHRESISRSHQKKQYLLALLAGFFYCERKHLGKDSYDEMNDTSILKLLFNLSMRYKIHSFMAVLFSIIRLKDFSIYKTVKTLPFEIVETQPELIPIKFEYNTNDIKQLNAMFFQKPALSIITACKDGLNLLKETAPTILNQSFHHWEWIIVDDGSEEPVGDYIKSLNDPRIIYFRNEKSLGQTKGLNLAIRQSRADWMVRMDGDDLAHLDKLYYIYQATMKTTPYQHSLIFSDYDVIEEDGNSIATIRYSDPVGINFYRYMYSKNNPICHPTVAFYKYSPNGTLVQYNENLKNAQDYDLWKRIYNEHSNSNPFLHIPVSLMKYRLVKQSLSGARILEQQTELNYIKKNLTNNPVLNKELVLNLQQQQGMYSYRVLYYRLIGKCKKAFFKNDLYYLIESLKYPPVFFKSIFFLIFRPFRFAVNQFFFHGVYR